jgi:hypothetical protein
VVRLCLIVVCAVFCAVPAQVLLRLTGICRKVGISSPPSTAEMMQL